MENPTFYYEGEPIKSDSCRKLREFGIKNMSVIEVETNSFNNNRSQRNEKISSNNNRSQRNETNSFSNNTSQKISSYNENSHEKEEYKQKINELESKLKE